jgi:PDZ domain-containing protein
MTLAVSATMLAILTFVAAGIRVPYIALTPGPVYNTLGTTDGKQVIQIKGHPSYVSKGRLDLTTVSVQGAPGYRPITLFEALGFWRDPDVAIVPREVQYPPGKDEKDIEAEVTAQMNQSQDAAKVAALRLLGANVTTSRLVVDSVVSDTPAAKVLKEDDEIKSVDGRTVTTSQQLRDAITVHKPGETVEIGYARGGRTLTAQIKTVAAPGQPTRAVVGISTGEVCPCEFPYDVDIALGEDVGGPSAGLMFTLAIVDTLTSGDMTGGVHIAGTGTIDVDGVVGPIGGIHQKLVGARRAGAVHFLVPAGNWDDAQQDPPAGLTLHKITSLKDAVAAVCAIGRSTDEPCQG